MAGLALAVDILARDKASGTLRKVGDEAGKTGKKFSGLKAGVAGLAGGALGAGIVSFGKNSVAAFKESEQSAAALEQAFAKFPRMNDRTAESFEKLNGALALKTRYDDDALASGQATLAQFNLTGQQVEQLTPLLADYASKTGQDLPTAAKALGMAFAGNTRALKQVGINYKSTGDAGQDFANIQALLSEKVGGFAENEGKTAAGQAAILQNQFGELQEEVGSKLVPMLVKLSQKLLEVIGFVQRNKDVIVPLVGVIGGLAAVVWTVNKAVKAYTAVQAALNVVMAMNPIGLVVIAIAGLVAALVIAYKKSETFRDVVNGAFNAIKNVVRTVIRFVVDKVLGWYELLITGAAKAFGWVPGIGGKLKTAADEFGKFRDRVNASLSEIQDKEVTIRLTKVGTGAEELNRIVSEKSQARGGSMPGAGRRAALMVTTVTNLDGRRIASSTNALNATRTRNGATPAFVQ